MSFEGEGDASTGSIETKFKQMEDQVSKLSAQIEEVTQWKEMMGPLSKYIFEYFGQKSKDDFLDKIKFQLTKDLRDDTDMNLKKMSDLEQTISSLKNDNEEVDKKVKKFAKDIDYMNIGNKLNSIINVNRNFFKTKMWTIVHYFNIKNAIK